MSNFTVRSTKDKGIKKKNIVNKINPSGMKERIIRVKVRKLMA